MIYRHSALCALLTAGFLAPYEYLKCGGVQLGFGLGLFTELDAEQARTTSLNNATTRKAIHQSWFGATSKNCLSTFV